MLAKQIIALLWCLVAGGGLLWLILVLLKKYFKS